MEDTDKKKNLTETRESEQLGILILDGSGTMKDPGDAKLSKCVEVDTAVKELITRLKGSTRNAEFFISIVTFDENVKSRKYRAVTEIDPTKEDYNPLHGHGGLTAIGDALAEADKIAEEFLGEQTEYPRSVVMILMTDGRNNSGIGPEDVANKIKNSGKRINIFTVGYGPSDEDIDIELLKKIKSDGGAYTRLRNPEDLRKFFMASLDAVR